jgi:putative NADH-flavin reductase
MRLTVFGPTGGTGAEIVRQAAAAGHTVTAVARKPERVSNTVNVHVVQGDVTDAQSLEPAVAGADAILSALGARSIGEPTTVYSAGTANVLGAMRRAGVRRFIGISAVPVGRGSEQLGPLTRYVIYPILYRFFGPAYDDMKRMEVVAARSDRDWTIFRPPQLVDAPASGKYRTAIDAPLPRAWRVSRADLAAAMLAAVEDASLVRHVVTIAG